MPTYTFMNLESGIEYDEVMSMTEYDKYMENNPNVERIFQPIALGSDHMMGVGPKVDAGFTENMQRISAAHPNSAMADRYGSGRTNAQIKAQGIVNKHKKK
mgnify:FL=1